MFVCSVKETYAMSNILGIDNQLLAATAWNIIQCLTFSVTHISMLWKYPGQIVISIILGSWARRHKLTEKIGISEPQASCNKVRDRCVTCASTPPRLTLIPAGAPDNEKKRRTIKIMIIKKKTYEKLQWQANQCVDLLFCVLSTEAGLIV